VVFVALVIRAFMGFKMESVANQSDEGQKGFYLARVNSPLTAVVVNLLIFAFVYIWTQSAQKSLIVSVLFAIPYYLIFISMESERFEFLARIPRSFIIESLVVAAMCLAIFRQVSDQPLLNNDAGFWLLFLSSIPLIAHAQLSAIWPNTSREETISL
jgi:hypothetical protein